MTYMREWKLKELDKFAKTLFQDDKVAVEMTTKVRLFRDAVLPYVEKVDVVNTRQFRVVTKSIPIGGRVFPTMWKGKGKIDDPETPFFIVPQDEMVFQGNGLPAASMIDRMMEAIGSPVGSNRVDFDRFIRTYMDGHGIDSFRLTATDKKYNSLHCKGLMLYPPV